MEKHTKVVALCSLAGVVLVGGIWMHQQNTISGNQRLASAKLQSAKRYKHDAKTFTVAKSEQSYDKSEPKLGTILQNNRHKIIHGLNFAFNGCYRQEDYDKHKSTISSDLGSDVGGDVLNYIKPKMSDYSDDTTPFSVAKGLTNYQIAYGHYDDSEKTVPVSILVNFKTPPINTKVGTQTNDKKYTYPHSGHMVIGAVLSTKDNSMQLNHEYHSIDGMTED